MKQKRKAFRIPAVIVLLLAVLYIVLVNLLVSAALVPSFMRRLDAFQRITDESYAAQVQTSDIQVNRQLALNKTDTWLEKVRSQKISVVTDDGYTLIATEFFPDKAGPEQADAPHGYDTQEITESRNGQGAAGHRWALVLHGYTGWKEEMYPFACWYQEKGYHVIVPDLRCQGESEGERRQGDGL